MRLMNTNRPAWTRWAGAAAILLLAASTATMRASDDKEKERPKEKRPAREASRPAEQRPARAPEAAPAPARARSESAPARSAPTPNAAPQPRQDRNPSSAPPARQESSPSYNPPNRQSQAPSNDSPARQAPSPSYNPPNRQSQAPSNDSPSRQAPSPSYNPQANRPSSSYSPNTPERQSTQPGANAPANTGGWRQVDRNGQTGAPARGNIGNQPAPAGSNNAPSSFGGQRQSGPAGARSPQVGGGSVRLPPGQTSRSNDGSAIHRANDGRVIHMDPRGRVTTVEVRGGGQVHYASNGRPDRVVTPSGAIINNRPNGVRQIVVERPGRVMIVTNPRGQGYIQRPFAVRGHEYYQRTYYVGGRPFVHVYRPYYYHGAYYPYYMPTRYYRPAYYGWVGASWGRPVIFSWGWGGSPWYGYYGPYFAPYPVYRSPLFWLTDFFIAATLQSAYDQRMADNAAAAQQEAAYQAQDAMRPEVKQMVADEVQRQLAQERADSQNQGNVMQDAPRDTLPGIFNDGASHALLVHNPLQVDDGAQGCVLSEGDVIGFEGNLTPGVETTSARVLASRGRDCRAGSTVTVPLQDILEMQNQLRETIDRGLGELQSKAGRDGIPAPPAQAMGAPIDSPLASALPPADPNGAAELSQQAQAATQAEQTVLSEAPPLDSDGNDAQQQPPTVSLGMTTSQVQSMLGQPKRVVDLGSKRMYIYDDMKVIFMDGRVADVQ